ncbi:flavodoxin [Georgenia sp. SUBG003]|uniref:flavodoxin n=1 Tax=Georgenia sp. SUBG003 TaxID=1497974 RepID=UPI0004D383E3|nr:hypothetical protein DA06_16995 [Georgenia sp. SUBG003]
MRSLERRTVLRGAVAFGLGAATTAMASCARGSAPQPGTGNSETSTDRPATTVLLAYFSRPGENYWYGDRKDLEVGNSKVIAEMVAAQVDADIFEIEPEQPYPHNYAATVERNRQEQDADARPKIAGNLPDLGRYRSIILGCPVWNTRAPMIIRTFLDGADLSGKTIHPFVTYALGGGRVFADYAELYRGATVAEGLAVQGEEATDAGKVVTQWLTESGLAGR